MTLGLVLINMTTLFHSEDILKKTDSLIFRYKGKNIFQAQISTSVPNYHLYPSIILNIIDTYFILLY